MIDSMMLFFTTNFVLYALVAGISLALVAGPLGSFIVWRRMSYFGDTLAHSALLGIALGLLTDSNPQLSIILSCLVFAFLLTLLDRRPSISTDTLLGILAHSSLALGIVVLALADSVRVDLEAYLFGALLTIGNADLIWVLVIVSLVAIVLSVFWNDFVSITVHAEIAEIKRKPIEPSSGFVDRINYRGIDENSRSVVNNISANNSPCGGTFHGVYARANGSKGEYYRMYLCSARLGFGVLFRCSGRAVYRCSGYTNFPFILFLSERSKD
jgi:hypothetical protein